MKSQPVFILLLLHVCLALAYVYLILLRKTFLRREYIIPVIVLPIFGPSMAFVIEWLNRLGLQGKFPIQLEHVISDEDILWKSLKSYHENGDIVPLEEAILIDDVRTRRKFMLETLYEDPLKYLDILMLAKNNEDVETSHYATTTISRAQRDFQVAIQKLAIAVESHPDDMTLLDKYIDTLGKYIESGLLEEHLLRNLHVAYKEALDRKLAMVKNDKSALIKKIRNSIELHDYVAALQTSDILKEHWPQDEQTWIEALRVCVEEKDSKQLAKILKEIRRSDIHWTKEGREQVGVWVESVNL